MRENRSIIIFLITIILVVALAMSPAKALEEMDWVNTWHKVKIKLNAVCEVHLIEKLLKIPSSGPAWIFIEAWDGVNKFDAYLISEDMNNQWQTTKFELTLIYGNAADALLQSNYFTITDNVTGDEIEVFFIVQLKGKEKDGELKSGKISNVVGMATLIFDDGECVSSMKCTGEMKKINKVPQEVKDAKYEALPVSHIFTIAEELADANSDTGKPGAAGIGSDGTNYLVAIYREDYSPKGLIGILLSSAGQILDEFVIAPYNGQLSHPSVAFDGTNYLVVYDYSGGIKGVRVSAAGNVIDSNGGFQISARTRSNWGPEVKFDGNQYLVVWNKFNGTNYDIYGSLIAPDVQVSPEFPVSTADGSQWAATLAFDGINYMAVWVDFRNRIAPDYYPDLYGTRISTSGNVLDSDGIAIATAETYQDHPKIAFDGSNYLVVWSDIEKTGSSPPIANIFGRRIRPDGTLLDGNPATNGIEINTIQLGKSYLTLTFNGLNYFVAWTVGAFSNSPPAGIYAARVSLSGNLIDAPANSLGLMIQGLPPDHSKLVHVTSMNNGTNSLIAWVVNMELSGDSKWLDGRFIYPF